MKAPGQGVIFAGACLLALGAGIFLGSGRLAASSGSTDRLAESPDTTSPQDGGSSPAVSTKPDTSPGARLVLMRRQVAACETTALWEWLEADPKGDHQIKGAVIDELIDRLGWGAWEHALAIGDAKMRERLSDSILSELSQRDPWKAYAEWQEHHAEFSHPDWGVGVIGQCALAASAISADKLLEVFQQVPRVDSEEMMVVEFAEDFDFRKVLDHIATAEDQPYTSVENLLPAWAKRSPAEAAAWLASHPGYLEKEYHEDEVGSLLEAIAEAEMSDESRRTALDAMASLSGEMLDRAWRNLAEGSAGKVSPAVLESADLMGRRAEYLRRTLLETRSADELDDSWSQVPLDERRQILTAAEEEWAEKRPTPVDAKARARWRTMVAQAWGIAVR